MTSSETPASAEFPNLEAEDRREALLGIMMSRQEYLMDPLFARIAPCSAMAPIDLPIECCQRLQVKLREFFPLSTDTDISLLIQGIDNACQTIDQGLTSVHPITPIPLRKRAAAESVDSSKGSSRPRKTARTRKYHPNTRNDGGTRGRLQIRREHANDSDGADDEREPGDIFMDDVTGVPQLILAETQVEPLSSMPSVTVPHDAFSVPQSILAETQAVPPSSMPSVTITRDTGFDETYELSSLTEESESSASSDIGESSSLPSLSEDGEDASAVESAHEEPAEANQQNTKGKKSKDKVWTRVANVRDITPKASEVLHSLTSIAEKQKFEKLMDLKNFLSATSEIQPPPLTTLHSLVKRCVHFESKVVDAKFRHLVSLVQLTLWFNQ